ncbi:MAG: alkaline phosphatase family protein, partial [Sphingomonadales bacterium]|nr:alkaline phosphatase family protein [Sphingomonadales bacterium]
HNKFVSALFPPIEVNNNLGQVVANAGMKQLRIAETEKYAHVTFFFNGGSEDVFTGEDRVLIPSPNVATYDLQPEMSADELTTTLVEKIENGGYDLIVVNFANPDMVGHTGILSAAISAVETIDTCLGRIVTSLDKSGGAMLVTADHGNVEQMANSETGAPHTAHTTLQVPVILTGRYINSDTKLNNGCLADIAPTILDIMGLKQPSEMTGRTLIK